MRRGAELVVVLWRSWGIPVPAVMGAWMEVGWGPPPGRPTPVVMEAGMEVGWGPPPWGAPLSVAGLLRVFSSETPTGSTLPRPWGTPFSVVGMVGLLKSMTPFVVIVVVWEGGGAPSVAGGAEPAVVVRLAYMM